MKGVARTLGDLDVEHLFSDTTSIGGGCIHPAVRIRSPALGSAFLKWAPEPGAGSFGIEAAGLEALRRADGPRVPLVLGFEEGGPTARGWLLLEYISTGRPTDRSAALLGSALARLHDPLDDSTPGWHEDGYIGPLPQKNLPDGLRWPAFWVESRLQPQWQSAAGSFDPGDRRSWDRLVHAVEPLLSEWEPDGMSLLHGDLWSGNVLTDEVGKPVLVDPAVYRGHREVDLAMMELFGGFPAGVMQEYERSAPLQAGYHEVRKALYQLYPLLVHVNLFGRTYVPAARDRIRSSLKHLG